MVKKEPKKILEMLTLEEKIALCSGHDFWHTEGVEKAGLAPVMMCDGPHGLRKQEGQGDHLGINDSISTVCYPSASALAASFDTEVLKALGEALGEECQAEQVGMLLGPGLNMKRSPLCGRNFEYFSEDPYLAGKLAAEYVRSLQGKGISACVKHFAANNQETQRMSGSSNMDERTLREIYLPAFEMAVKEGKTRSVMCAYNAINGVFCSENKKLLTDILREEWGFEGFVVTDWGAAKDAAKGVKAGLNLVMPGGYGAHEEALKKALESGELTEKELDAVILDILQFICDAAENQRLEASIDRKECAKLSGELAAQCAVLLKNDGALPLKKEARAAFIGAFAEKPRYQGSGSSHINVAEVTSVLDALHGQEGVSVSYAKGFEPRETKPDATLMEEAVELAKKADVAVIFAGLPDSFESEGFDRKHLDLPENQNALIEAVCRVQEQVVVVLHGGATMCLPWADKAKAILCMYLGGQEVGRAAAELLYGEKNPCGKLAETWPLKLEDNPSYLNFPGVDGSVNYREDVYIGYRYYDKKKMEVRFPFGHGLSYTTFAYRDLKLEKASMTDQETLRVSCKVKNTGSRAGKEAVQLYVRDVESTVGRPVRELKGFAKVDLEPGEEKAVSFTLDKRSFAYYETQISDWFVESGEFVIEIGASSRDIRLSQSVQVEGTVELPCFYSMQSPIGSLRKTARGRKVLEQIMAAGEDRKAEQESQMEALGEGAEQMQQAMFLEMPLGALAGFGSLSMEQVEEIVRMLNEN
ncbi:MAG: glycoside hydrolase family 3 C-terminal domain-containing protein [Eubacteriales bacterium]|nr:glycoside hydrolase family 3 C-terminal domain-containing protein [Eubacteriales bacterium]